MCYVCDILFNFAYLKMQPPNCVFMSILLMIADGLTVRCPSGPLVAPLGSSVVLPCYVDELLLQEDLEVEWRRTDSESLVHLFLDGESRAEAQQEDYHDRAHFFTDQIQHGNFSLRLDNLRAEDEGKYTCKVYSQQESGETVVQIKYVERLLVSGSNQPVSAYDGEDVTLNCSVDSHITPEDIEEVSWKKTDEDEDILALLYQNNQTFPDSSDEQYRDRVEFFTDEIPKGNFSLRLKSVRTEDKGVYMCEVFAGELSANATVVLEQLGFSTFHIILLILCIAAALGAILLYSLMCCRSSNTVSSCTVWNLQKYSVIFPNICMFFAFIFWGLTEGFQNETITCCALHILRPFMLVKYHKDSLGSLTWIRISSLKKELAAFTALVFAVFFIDTWTKSAHDRNIVFRIIFGMVFGYVLLFCFTLSRGFKRMHVKWIGLYFLSLAQFFLLIISQGLPSPGFLPVPIVHAVLLMCMPCKYLCRRWIILLWIITLPLLDIALVIYVHLCILEKLKDYLEWICVIAFLEVLRIKVAFEDRDFVAERSRDQRQQQTEASQQGSNALHLCNKIMYMFGAVGLVLLSSVTLTAELILKARYGERFMKDLRVIVFPSECVFALYWLVLQIHAFYLKN